MEFYCYVLAGALTLYLDSYYSGVVDRLRNWIYRTVGTSLAGSLKLLDLCQSVAGQKSFLIGIYLVNVHFN